MYLLLFFVVLALCIYYAVKMQEAVRLKNEINKARKEYGGVIYAKVLEVRKRRVFNSMVCYYPQFFYEINERTYTVGSPVFSTRNSDFVPGSVVKIKYDEKRPEAFMIADDEELYKMASDQINMTLFGVIGVWVIYLFLFLIRAF